MDIGDIFKDSLKYPLSDGKQFAILGILGLIGMLGTFCAEIGINNSAVSTIFEIIAIIVILIAGGYELKIIKNAINVSDEIAEFNISKDFVGGIKYLFVNIIYFIIPFIIALIVAWATGAFNSGFELFSYAINSTISNTTVPESVANSFAVSFAITGIISTIVFLIFAIFQSIAVCRLANSGSFKEAFAMHEIVDDLKNIGWGKFIAWGIIYLIILFILAIIFGLISAVIPYVGALIYGFIFEAYLALFTARSLGLIYSNA